MQPRRANRPLRCCQFWRPVSLGETDCFIISLEEHWDIGPIVEDDLGDSVWDLGCGKACYALDCTSLKQSSQGGQTQNLKVAFIAKRRADRPRTDFSAAPPVRCRHRRPWRQGLLLLGPRRRLHGDWR